MKIEYRETTNDLLTRIDIHQRYGSRDIDAWMLDLLRPAPGSRILDVGCGAGKQCFLFDEHLGGQATIVGGDVSPELLAKARQENARRGNRIEFRELDFNAAFPFEAGGFDLLSCCFAIYYAADVGRTVAEMERVLRPGGRLFTTGPMPENKRLFYDVIAEATGRSIPPMPGSSRYASEILETLRRRFDRVEVHVFENPLTFHDAAPFMDYVRASLSEDRKLWGDFFRGGDDFDQVLRAIERNAAGRLGRDGSLVMTKVVGGFVAHKAQGDRTA
jgi:ubiquinone/menaquinone biosynthesis C-methylase UbiE